MRNALDHGLEPPAQRLQAGKPAQGRLVLSACHESGSVLIAIDDDGRGIQRDKVLARAWERGLVEPGVRPADEDIDRLIFAPGFSTAEKVTNLSGRGVGMDVRFIFPLDAVVEVIEPRSAIAETDAHGRRSVELRGQVLPVVALRALYGLGGDEPARPSIVVLRAGTRRFGVLVDQLLGQHQTVIKPLGRMFRSLRGMAGSSILGNGEVALIFDVPALGQLAEAPPPAPPHHPGRGAAVPATVPHEGQAS